MDYSQTDSSNNLNIPLIYVSPAEGSNERLKQTQNKISVSREGELFDEVLSQFDFENINLPNESLNLISNDKYNFNKSTDSPGNVPNINVLNPENNNISFENSNTSNNNDIFGNEVDDDDIKSFYSALEEISGLNDAFDNKQAENFINNEIFGLNDASNNNRNNLQTSFLLPDMEKIKSNASNHLSISRVNSREGRPKSISKSNHTRSRSRSRSRTRSISNLSNKDEAVLINALRDVNLVEKEKNNNFLAIDQTDTDYVSDVSESDILSILSEFEVKKDFNDFENFVNNSNRNNQADSVATEVDTSPVDDSEKKFVCKFCNFAFLRNHDLDRHMASHLNRKNYPCKGYILGKLPQRAMFYLDKEHDLRMNPSSFNLNQLKATIDYVENQPLTVTWGCFKEFLRSDSLSRHLKSKTEHRCMKAAFDDFIEGNVFFHYKFLKLKEIVLYDPFKIHNEEHLANCSEKFIQAEILIKDMDISLLNNASWPITEQEFERNYRKIYGKNLQKYIQRQARFKKMAEKDITTMHHL
ncbi:hypothetical protein DAHU10_033770 [Hanseniaspora uvarum]|nr:hypothetical protein DAHU10_033770 [Hanseniaspora uvarum]